jgi:hypothetical protein
MISLFISIDETATTEEISSEPTLSPVSDEPIVVDKILLVNTENVTHDKYEQTAELKVGENYFSMIIYV